GPAMRLAANAGSEDRKKFIAVCAFAVIAVLVLYFELRDPTPVAAPTAAPLITSAAPDGVISPAGPSSVAPRKLGTTDAALDPTLHMDPMRRTESVAYEGTGRNVFSPAPPEL